MLIFENSFVSNTAENEGGALYSLHVPFIDRVVDDDDEAESEPESEPSESDPAESEPSD